MPEDIYDEYPSLTLAKEGDQNIEPLKLGQRIKDIRGKLGITLEEASQRTGLARSTLSKIENEQDFSYVSSDAETGAWIANRHAPTI